MKHGGPARLLFPALRWSAETGYAHEEQRIEHALRRGVGGFCIFGGTTDTVSELTYRTQSRCDHALLFGADLERGAGQQFRGATPLPPLAAIGARDDLEATRRAARITAREALALGINWVYAPDADVDLEPRNPIVGTRSFGSDPERVAAHVGAWIDGCHAAGAMACAKHFPGHGRTVDDSHAMLPVVGATRAELELDLAPFRAAVRAEVDSIMTAHVVYPALDASGTAATLSRPILHELLRGELGYQGLIVTDAVNMQGVLDAAEGDEAAAAIAAFRAGCNGVLYPNDLDVVADALEAAQGGLLARAHVEESRERFAQYAERHPPRWGYQRAAEETAWVQELAVQCVLRLTGEVRCPPNLELLTIDDDVGGPFPAPSREPFALALNERGIGVEPVRAVSAERPLLVAIYADVRAWKSRPGLSDAALATLRGALQVRRDALVVLFAHPRVAEQFAAHNVVAAWGGETVMQQAAADWLGRHAARTFL